jgi:hypothetical protein
MGILCELFVSTPRNALRFEKRLEEATRPAYERSDAKGLTPLAFETLWSILLGEPFDPRRHQLEDLYFGSHLRSGFGKLRQRLLVWKAIAKSLLGAEVGDSWLHRFPATYVTALAELNDTSLQSAAAQWAQTEELRRRTEADAQHVLNELRRLAIHAVSHRQQLFLWGST